MTTRRRILQKILEDAPIAPGVVENVLRRVEAAEADAVGAIREVLALPKLLVTSDGRPLPQELELRFGRALTGMLS